LEKNKKRVMKYMFNGKTYALGDIHGVLEPLERMEKVVDLSKDRVFLLGDYVDRVNTDIFHSKTANFKNKNIVIFEHTPIDQMEGWKENGYKNLLQDGSTLEIIEHSKGFICPVINKSKGYINIDTFGVCNFRYPTIYQNLSYTLLNLDDLTYMTIQKQ